MMGLQTSDLFPNMNNQAYKNTQDFQESSDLPSSMILVIPRGDLPLMYRGTSNSRIASVYVDHYTASQGHMQVHS